MKKCIYCGAELVDRAVFCAKCGKPQEMVSQKVTKEEERKGHPVLAGVFLFMSIVCLFLGITSMMLRYTLSGDHIKNCIEKSKISELAIGDAVYTALKLSAESIHDEEFSAYVEKLDKNTTISELIYDAVKESDGEISKKEIRNGLDDKYFKRELARLIVNYTDDLLYNTGKGEVDKDDIENLLDAFGDGMGLERTRSIYGSVSLGKEIADSLNEEDLEAYSVKNLSRDIPIMPLRVFVSPVFLTGIFIVALIMLIAAIRINQKGNKQVLKSILIVVVTEVILVLLLIMITRLTGDMLVKTGVSKIEFDNVLGEIGIGMY